jgi:hypothetical protein
MGYYRVNIFTDSAFTRPIIKFAHTLITAWNTTQIHSKN